MRKEDCEFSSFTIHPGHGRKYIPFAFISTKPVLTFFSKKSMGLYMRKKNPRTVPWTKTFRQLHKKTTTDRVVRRRTVKTAKITRAIVGADLSYIQESRTKNKEDRSAKSMAIRAELKERKAAGKGAIKANIPKAKQ